MDKDEKKTFEEWISGFEGRYTPEQMELFEKCWNHTVATRNLIDDIGADMFSEEQRWNVDWINDVAYRIGK